MLFGINTTILAVVGLVGFSVAALLYAVLFSRIERQNATEKRIGKVAESSRGPRDGGKSDNASARRRNVQDTLKDIEVKQKHKASQAKNPPLLLRLQQAGLAITERSYYTYSAAAGVVLALLTFAMGMPLLIVIGAAFVGAFGLPRFVLGYLTKRRRAAFIEELANAVEVIVRGVKAGLPLNDCLRMIASEAKEPVRTEFRNITDALQIGIPIDQAVSKMFERMPLAEANFFAIVIAIQSKAGGNLSEALGNLAKVLRERKKMRAKIKAMSAEAKSSAAIIGSLPLIVMGLVYVTSPAYILVLFTTAKGQVVLGVSALVMMTGILVMRKMINFDF